MSDRAFNIINSHYVGGNTYMDDFKVCYDNNENKVIKRITKDTEMILSSQKKTN